MAEMKRKPNEKALHIAPEADAVTDQPPRESDIISDLLALTQPAYAADQSGSLLYSNQSYRDLVDAARKAEPGDDADHEGDLLTPAAMEQVARARGAVWLEQTIGSAAAPRRYRGLHFPIHEKNGRVTVIGGVYYDYSREYALTKRVKLTQDRYVDLTRLISDWIWEADRDFNLTFVSPRIMETTAMHPRLLIGANLFDFGRFAEATRETPNINSRSPFRNRLFLITIADGSVRQCRLSGMPVFDRVSGDFMGYRGTGKDITDELEAEARASVAQNRLGDAIESISEAIALFDSDNRLVECNEKYREFHLANAASIVPGMSYEKIIRAESGQFAVTNGNSENWVEQELERQRNPQGAYEQQLSNGRWLKVSHQRTADGGTISIRTDITEFKQREEALRKAEAAAKEALVAAELANRAKSEFLANMSHELRTPLNAINGFSEIILKEMFGPLTPTRYVDYIKDIHDSGTHLYSLINDILDTSKIEFGKLELNLGVIDIRSLMTRCVRLVADRAEHGKLEITIEAPEDLPKFRADERKLKQIVLNLLSNAVKFTAQGGAVTVTAGVADNGGLMISVEDNGIGIAPEDIETVMAPFGQVDGTLSRRYEGTGLGMSLSKSLIELHGGSLLIESRVDVGTKVTIRLPVIEEQPT